MSAAAALVVLTSGCSSSLSGAGPEPTTLADARFVIALSPSFDKLVDFPAPGAVVFVDNDGSLGSIATDGIDGGLLALDGGTLYFTDQHTDYVLTDSLTATDRETREYSQELLVATDVGYVSVFNSNYSDDGSTYQFDVSTGPGLQERRYPHYFELLTECDDDVFGVAVPEGVSDTNRATRTLVQLHPVADDSASTWSPGVASLQEGLGAPCVDRELSFLSTELTTPADPEMPPGFGRVQLRSWNVDTGEVRSTPLVDDAGSPLAERNWEYPYLTRSSWTIVGDTFYWIDGDGILLGTDRASGSTHEIVDLGLTDAQSSSNRVHFEGDTLWLLDLAPATGAEATIASYDLATGARKSSEFIDGLRAIALSKNLMVTDFLVK
jgi:hypothetical protein